MAEIIHTLGSEVYALVSRFRLPVAHHRTTRDLLVQQDVAQAVKCAAFYAPSYPELLSADRVGVVNINQELLVSQMSGYYTRVYCKNSRTGQPKLVEKRTQNAG
jgi:hypothetical protein